MQRNITCHIEIYVTCGLDSGGLMIGLDSLGNLFQHKLFHDFHR